MNPPDTAPPAPAPPAPQTPKAATPRALSLREKCMLAIATAAWLKLGCAGVQMRPEPDDCPKKTIRAMEDLGWGPSEVGAMWITIDVNQPLPKESIGRDPAYFGVYKDGPITGALTRRYGRALEGTTLEGHLWTSGDRVYGRYLWANVPGKGRVPICVEIGDTGDLGIPKEPGSKPGAVSVPKEWGGYATREWR